MKIRFSYPLLATIVILGMGVTAFLIFQQQVFGFFTTLEDRVIIEDQLPQAQIQETVDEPVAEPSITEQPPDVSPEGFTISSQDLLSRLLETLAIKKTETFDVTVDVKLIDANMESTVESSFLKVQPLDPRTVIIAPSGEIDPSRLFLNTDFSTQTNDAGTNHHKFTGWDIVNDFGGGASIPVSIITTSSCRVTNTGICVQVIGAKSKDDDTRNGSVFHGISRIVDMSDWTREGGVKVKFDYDCNAGYLRSARFLAIFTGDASETHVLTCSSNNTMEFTLQSATMGNNNGLRVSLGAQATNVDKFAMDIQYNNVQVIANSVAKREAIETLQSLSIVQNDQEQRILNLGFIETTLVGKTFADNERVLLEGFLETRIDDKTLSKLPLSASGITINNEIPLRIDGQENFIFKLDGQFFTGDSFHTFKIYLNDFIVNVGSGEEQRTFEYHTPYLAYSLEFRVFEDQITAFNQENKAITYPVSDSTFQICGLTSSPTVPELLPPKVSIIHNGFTIAETNPSAGISGFLGENVEFCSIIPNLPKGTTITFKVKDNFFDINTPITQNNYFLKCVRTGCNSNIGFTEVF